MRIYHQHKFGKDISLEKKITEILKDYEIKMGKPPELIMTSPKTVDVIPPGLSNILFHKKWIQPAHFMAAEYSEI